nr:PGPGW domain-containing protein [Nocardiopsis baichengensis]
MPKTPLAGLEDQPDPSGSRPSPARTRHWRRLRARLRVWRMRMHAHPVLHLTWRSVVAVVGSSVLIAGIIMCVTPGPGIGGILMGLVILSTEFSWARGLLRRARVWARRGRDKAIEADQKRRAKRALRKKAHRS